jgi:hypothetical protein
MTETTQRSFRDLVTSTNVPLSPIQASDAQMRDMSKGENLTVYAVESKDNDEFGQIWELDVLRPNNERLLFGLWSNPQRDQTMTSLMVLCQDGPVSGVLLENRGSDKKPFYVITPA